MEGFLKNIKDADHAWVTCPVPQWLIWVVCQSSCRTNRVPLVAALTTICDDILPLFIEKYPNDTRLTTAVEKARALIAGTGTLQDLQQACKTAQVVVNELRGQPLAPVAMAITSLAMWAVPLPTENTNPRKLITADKFQQPVDTCEHAAIARLTILNEPKKRSFARYCDIIRANIPQPKPPT